MSDDLKTRLEAQYGGRCDTSLLPEGTDVDTKIPGMMLAAVTSFVQGDTVYFVLEGNEIGQKVPLAMFNLHFFDKTSPEWQYEMNKMVAKGVLEWTEKVSGGTN